MRKNWAERFSERAQKTPLLVLLSFAAVLISSLLVVTGAVVRGVTWYRHRANWRTVEYKMLNSLAAGFSLEQFKARLGAPVFIQTAPKLGLLENSFRGRGFWVQTVSDRRGVVLLYTVTSCAKDFSPTFGSSFGLRIKLHRSTFDQIVPTGRGYAYGDYWYSGATANSYFFENLYGGNPGNYKTLAWGIDDACPTNLDPGWYFVKIRGQAYHGPIGSAPQPVRRFRKAARVNTYAETAPGTSIEPLRRAFQIGVDRILVRTAPPA